MKILLAPDKFKGSLNAAGVAAALARGIQKALPESVLISKPIADGGEGFADALSRRKTSVNVHDPLGRKVLADYGWLDDHTAVIEMSAASGLWRLTSSEREPLRASTFGTGELILNAVNRGASKILVGIGGSATNDGGAGMAAALGYQFLDSKNQVIIPTPENLSELASIKTPANLVLPTITAACDVNNPLLGITGATRVYGPQKGAKDLDLLERALEHLAEIVSRDLACDFRSFPGAGAAGGLGFGLMSFCGATIESGFDLVAKVIGLEEAIAQCDLVITGEGKIDAQTLHGKGPAGVAALAAKYKKPVIAFAGMHETTGGGEGSAASFDSVIALVRPGVSISEAINNAASLLELAAEEMASNLGITHH